MDLKIKDVAELLHVSENTVRKWLMQKKIPAYRLNQQYRFNRDEIENWMMQCKPEESEAMFQKREKIPLKSEKMRKLIHTAGMQKFSLFRAIHKGMVLSQIEAANKEGVIHEATTQLAKNLKLDAEVLTDLLLDRERMMPTALNHGIGVPHTRDFLLKEPLDVVSIVYLKKPIEYGALDGRPVHTLFFLFSSEDKTHLHLLAKIAHLASHESAREFLQKRPVKEKLLEYIRSWEENLNH